MRFFPLFFFILSFSWVKLQCAVSPVKLLQNLPGPYRKSYLSIFALLVRLVSKKLSNPQLFYYPGFVCFISPGPGNGQRKWDNNMHCHCDFRCDFYFLFRFHKTYRYCNCQNFQTNRYIAIIAQTVKLHCAVGL